VVAGSGANSVRVLQAEQTSSSLVSSTRKSTSSSHQGQVSEIVMLRMLSVPCDT